METLWNSKPLKLLFRYVHGLPGCAY